jgi:hypothetical protein
VFFYYLVNRVFHVVDAHMRSINRTVLIILAVLLVLEYASCFRMTIGASQSGKGPFPHLRVLYAEISRGDAIREATGIRPSLHPTTINALAETLRMRAMGGETCRLRVSETVKPLDVVIETGKIVTEFLLKRRETSGEDGMTFEVKEEQTIAGRVVGVIMRLDELGVLLYERVSPVGWVRKYDEWASFGVLEDESQVETRIKKDPLFTMARAECLLALFLNTVEAPKLMAIGETVPDGSRIDFIETDRLEVLLGEFQ